MANCTISTMAVNDCHLQFFDSLGNLIYEFDLETIIALNNGNGILIKDDLTTLTIDNNIVVDNLTMTIAELITYIQEQRVLCDCCASAPAASVTSASWGYDSDGVIFYVKQMSNGSVVYESPIGTVTAPTGDVQAANTLINSLSHTTIEATNTSGTLVPNMASWKIQNTGGGAGTIDAVNFPINAQPIEAVGIFINSLGQFHDAPIVNYDATATTFFITYTTY